MSNLQPLSHSTRYELETAATIAIENEADRPFNGPIEIDDDAEELIFPEKPVIFLSKYDIDRLIKLVGAQPCAEFGDLFNKLSAVN